ncbi:conserved hypothetical protein [Thioalkalivibrio sp. K90mix]|jgi:NADH:ubiquinone oxidoreductase subunit 4 (subunit M)|uniref:hypothetical protein n=1 Tax=Thioalkalivibrio sp. (strain K90mix) TaxID=396595 RepID=UPI000195A7DC|nr:hypothetical protein [Thioalkalivibrio sp. K90mix]ADC71395.1 conserved hypothetical protein [Thioalkalivibrio sp. K90mix]
MSVLLIFLAAVFLPLFPMSLVFNALAARITSTYVQVFLFVIWPQIGVAIILWGDLAPAHGLLIAWAGLSAILYAFRLLTIREVGRWAAMLASSAWPLVWLFVMQRPTDANVIGFALAMTAAPVLMLLVRDALARRLESAYTGLHGGLARDLPRLSGVIVVTTLAAMALPLFPGFFALLALLGSATPGIALGVLLTWLLWSWAGARLLQGTVFGPRSGPVAEDLSATTTWAFTSLLVLLVISGLLWTGGAL